ncbi:hypothetical protein [Pseudonocardia sp. DLS-67]
MEPAQNARPVWPHGRYPGEDGTRRVHVELDGAARDVAVVLDDGWRSALGPQGLAAAVLQGFSAATTARLAAWATAPFAEPARARPHPPATASSSRAWRDLREFRHRLTTLHHATETAASPGRLVVATIRAGGLVGLELDPQWLRTAATTDVERHIGHALRAALALIAALPERALQGCPDLAAFLAGSPFAPPFAQS